MKIFCDIRVNNPELSLAAIVSEFETKYKIKISKSCLSHYIKQIKQIYNKK